METIDKLNSEADAWTLSSDMKLLSALREYSANFSERTSILMEKVDDLTSEVSSSHVRLRNVFNEFILMSNTQFIENRVYDDDDDDEEAVDETKAFNLDDVEIDPLILMRKAYDNGRQALKLFIDDESSNEGKLEDIYNIRPLPYIIGSKEFDMSIDAGLGDVVEVIDDESRLPSTDQAIADTASVLSDTNDKTSTDVPEPILNHPIPPPPPGAHRPPPPPPPQTSKMSSGPAEDEYDLKSANKEDDSTPKPRMANPSLPSLSNALAAQIRSRGQKSSNELNEDENEEPKEVSFADKKKVASQLLAPKRDENPSTTKPPVKTDVKEEEEEEEDDLFSVTIDDPYSLFGGASQTNRKIKRDSLAGLFGDIMTRERSDSISSDSSSSSSNNRGIGGLKKRPSISALFGDSNDSSLFDDATDSSKQAPQTKIVEEAIVPTKSKVADLFSEDSSAPSQKPATSTAKPKSAMRSVGAADLFSGGLFGDVDQETQSSPAKASVNDTKKSSKSAAAANKFASLFGDDTATDLFGESTTKSSQPAASTQANKPRKSIFADEDEAEDDPLFGKKSAPKTSTASAPITAPVSKPTAPITVKADPTPSRPVSKAIPKSLFGDDDEDDDKDDLKPIVKKSAAPSAVEKNRPKSTKSLFDDDDDDDIFPAKKSSSSTSSSAPKSSISDTATTDNRSLLKTSESKVSSTVQTSSDTKKAVSKSLFDDDDDEIKPSKLSSQVKSSEVPIDSKPQTLSTGSASVTSSIPVSNPVISEKQSRIGIPLPARPKVDDSDDDEENNVKPSKPSFQVKPQEKLEPSGVPIDSKPQTQSTGAPSVTSSIPVSNPVIAEKQARIGIPLPARPKVDDSDEEEEDNDSQPVKVVSSQINSSIAPVKQQTANPLQQTPIIAGSQTVQASSDSSKRPSLGIPLPARPKVDDSDSDEDSDPKKVIVTTNQPSHVPQTVQSITNSNTLVDDATLSASVDKDESRKSVSSLRNSMNIDPTRHLPGIRSTSLSKPRSSLDGGEQGKDVLIVESSGDADSISRSRLSSQDSTSEKEPASFSKKVTGSLASRMAGLDPSKIIMPGMAPPKGLFSPPPTSPDKPIPKESPKITSESASEPGLINVTANMDRATMKKSGRRAPAKKSMLFGDQSEESVGDILGAVASVAQTLPISETIAALPQVGSSLTKFDVGDSIAISSKISSNDDGDMIAAMNRTAAVASKIDTNDAAAIVKQTSESVTAIGKMGSMIAESDAAPVIAAAVKSSLFDDPISTKKVPVTQTVQSIASVAQLGSKIAQSDAASMMPSKSLFDDTSGLFGAVSQATKVAAGVMNTSPDRTLQSQQSTKKSSLFDDESNEIYAKPSKPVNAEPSKKSLFDDDGDIFSKKSDAAPVKKSSNLFGDDDDDPLFSKPKPSTEKKKKGLFDDE